VIEGSTDRKSWMEVGRRTRDNNMNWPDASAIFAISRAVSVRMSRLRQGGPNHMSDDSLDMIVLVIFDSLIE
jgi:hypothetical protein